jgi:hypothetical protein
MRALKIIGVVILVLVAIGGVGAAAYFWGTSQNNQTVITNNTTNTDNNSSANNNVQPKVVTEPTCNADELALTLGEGEGGAAGSQSLSLVFTNTGARECTLAGYPGVSLVNANGNQVGSPAEQAPSSNEQTVTLQPNDVATALVTYPVEQNFDPGTCTDGATKLRVYPPNDYGYLSIPSPITGWCPGFQVNPVVAQ